MADAEQQWRGRALRVSAWGRFGFAILIGLLFWLPHAVRIITLHSAQQYTPFSVITPNNTVWDESFLYAAQVNTMLQQHRRADDTDSWEHRGSYFPYSILPAGAEVAVAEILAPGHPRKGLKRAQILFHLLFPAIMAWQIMTLLDPSRRRLAIAATLALLVMVVAFSARTLLGGVLSWFGGASLGTLQAARSPNPNISFVICLAAVLLLLRALRMRSPFLFVAAGLVGSLLFYAYYAISWCAACLLLALLSLRPATRILRQVFWTLAASCVGAVPYLLWTHASKVSGSYSQRMARVGIVYSHAVSPQAVRLTVFWGSVILTLVLCWLWTRSRTAPGESRDSMHHSVLVIGAVAIGGLAGMNMQVVTGFNAQAEFHFTHMVVQPAVVLLAALLLSWSQRAAARPKPWLWRAAFALLFLACAASQVSAGMHSAPFHRMNASDEALFDWLASHSKIGAVVATTNLRVDLELPIYTHDRVLVVNGTRAAGSDDAAVERLLLANRLAGSTSAQMLAELRGDIANPDGVQIETYGWYLFESSPFLNPFTHNFAGAQLPAIMHRYQQMDPAQELKQFRVDYIYTRNGDTPAAIKGWSFTQVLHTPEGSLWQLQAAPAA